MAHQASGTSSHIMPTPVDLEAGLEPAPSRLEPGALPLSYSKTARHRTDRQPVDMEAGLEPAPTRSEPGALPLSYSIQQSGS